MVVTITGHEQRVARFDDIVVVRGADGPVAATPIPVVPTSPAGTELLAWYPLRDTSEFSPATNRYGVDEMTLFGNDVEYVATRRPDRIFTVGGGLFSGLGVNLFEIPATPGVMTLLDTQLIPPGFANNYNTIPGKAGFLRTPGIMGSGGINVAVASVNDDAIVLDYDVAVTRAQLAAIYPQISTNTPHTEGDCCFDTDGKFWVFVTVSGGSFPPYVLPAMIALRFNEIGAIDFSRVVTETFFNGVTTVPAPLYHVIVTARAGVDGRGGAVAYGNEMWVFYWLSVPTSVSTSTNTFGILKFDTAGGVVNEVFNTTPNVATVQALTFHISRSGASGVSVLLASPLTVNGVIVLPYVMFTDHWVADNVDQFNAGENPLAVRYLRSWGIQEGTYGEWETITVPADLSGAVAALTAFLEGVAGHSLTRPEAEALVLSLLGVADWATAGTLYGPGYASFELVALSLFGVDRRVTRSIHLWDAGDYETKSEFSGLPRTEWLVPDDAKPIRSLANNGILMTTGPTIGAITTALSDVPVWLADLGGDAPATAVVVIGFGGTATPESRGTANIIAHQQGIRSRTGVMT